MNVDFTIVVRSWTRLCVCPFSIGGPAQIDPLDLVHLRWQGHGKDARCEMQGFSPQDP